MPKSISDSHRLRLRWFMLTASFTGRLSMAAFLLFLFFGPFGSDKAQSTWTNWWATDTLLSTLFFIQHSTMVRRGLRSRLAGWVPEYCHGAIFTISSALALGTVMAFWQPSGIELFAIHGPGRWLMHLIFFAALVGLGWGAWALSSFDPLGTGPIKAHIEGRLRAEPTPFSIRGPYLWVRHPLYFFVLILLWFRPDLTADRLLFNLLWSGWIYLGTVMEEKDLVSEFGDLYRRYQVEVPMLIPWKGYKRKVCESIRDGRG